jgi:hypothetical protein
VQLIFINIFCRYQWPGISQFTAPLQFLSTSPTLLSRPSLSSNGATPPPPLAEARYQSWATEAMKQWDKVLNAIASISLPALNASLLHCFNFFCN